MSKQDRKGDLADIFEILDVSYAQKGGVVPGESDLSWKPATDAYETDDEFVIQMDLAGMDPAQIEVLADETTLLVRGIRQDSSGTGKKHFHEMEINVGPFARRVPLPVGVDLTSATARYHSGFLYVTFAKGETDGPARRQVVITR